MKYEDAESSLKSMIILVRNVEAVPHVLENLQTFINNVLTVVQHTNEEDIQTLVQQLFNQLIKTITNKIREYNSNSANLNNQKKPDQLLTDQNTFSTNQIYQLMNHFNQLTTILEICFELIKTKQFIQYIAMVTINKILDIAFTNSIYEYINYSCQVDIRTNKNQLTSNSNTNLQNVYEETVASNTSSYIRNGSSSPLVVGNKMASSSSSRRQSVVNVIRQTGTRLIESLEQSATSSISPSQSTHPACNTTSCYWKSPPTKSPMSHFSTPNSPLQSHHRAQIGAISPTSQVRKSLTNINTGETKVFEENSQPQKLQYKCVLLDILEKTDPGIIVNLLQNRITMQKRTLGHRIRCSPSVRMRSCSIHCIQILSARVLVVMSQFSSVQQRLWSDGHFKTLVDALDANYDPHLLCLLLQCLATIALEPSYHESLLQIMIEDNLLHLILPSDDWYYTNLSTRFAPYVKYHAARLLVYLGKFHCLSGRFDLFNNTVFESVYTTDNFLTDNAEDMFIHNMALGKHFIYRGDMALIGCSVEAVIRILLEDQSTTQSYCKTPEPLTLLASFLGSDSGHFTNLPIKKLQHALLLVLPIVIHPIIIIRILIHRLFGKSYRKKIRQISSKESAEDQPIKSLLSNSLANTKRRPSFVYCETMKAEAEGHKVICPWEGELNKESVLPTTNLKRQSNTNQSFIRKQNSTDDTKVNQEEPKQSAPAQQLQQRFGKWRISLKKKSNQSEQSEDNNSGIKKNEDKKINQELLEFQRELMNLPKYNASKLDPNSPKMHHHLGDSSRSASPSLLLSRSNSLPNVIVTTNTTFTNTDTSRTDNNNNLLMDLINDTSLLYIDESSLNSNVDTDDSPLENKKPEEPAKKEIFSKENSLPEIFISHSPTQLTHHLVGRTETIIESNISINTSNSKEEPMSIRSLLSTEDEEEDEKSRRHSYYGSERLLGKSEPTKSTIRELSIKRKMLQSSLNSFPRDDTHQNKTMSPNISIGNMSSVQGEGEESQQFVYKSDKTQDCQGHVKKENISSLQMSAMQMIDLWMQISVQDLCLVRDEMKEFLTRLSCQGNDQRLWAQNVWSFLKSQGNFNKISKKDGTDGYDSTNIEYKRLKQLVTSGDLPCTKDDAATLASVHLHIDSCWPDNLPSNNENDNNNNNDTNSNKNPSCSFSETITTRIIDNNNSIDNNYYSNNIATIATPPKSFNYRIKPNQPTGYNYVSSRQWVPNYTSTNHNSQAVTRTNSNSAPSLDQQPTLTNSSLTFLTQKLGNNSRLSSSRMRNRRVFRVIQQFNCISSSSDKECERQERETKRLLARYIPPDYHDSNKTHELIKEKYKKLWHTPLYESEVKLKQLYIKLCKNLPAYNCRLFQVREILRGNIHQNVHRILGVSPSNIILLDSKSKLLLRTQHAQEFKNWHLTTQSSASNPTRRYNNHDNNNMSNLIPSNTPYDSNSTGSCVFELEFRAGRPWLLQCSNESSIRGLVSSLWEVLDLDGTSATTNTTNTLRRPRRRGSLEFDLLDHEITLRPDMINGMVFSAELDELSSLIYFPEEVAILLAQREWRLFQNVQSQSYIRHVSLDLSLISSSSSPTSSPQSSSSPLNQHKVQSQNMNHSYATNQNPYRNDKSQSEDSNTGGNDVWAFVTRLKEVSSWVIHLIITQPSHEERKMIFSCLLRVALVSYGIGNFNGAVEILTGLKSEKLKPFWLTITNSCRLELFLVDLLSKELLSSEPTQLHQATVHRALQFTNLPVIPFFGTFLTQLKNIVNKTPNIIILPTQYSHNQAPNNICSLTEFNGEDRFISRLGVGGLVNMNKMREVMLILNDISMLQQHNRAVDSVDELLQRWRCIQTCSWNTEPNNMPWYESSDGSGKEDSTEQFDAFYTEFIDVDYTSIVPMKHQSGLSLVSIVPVNNRPGQCRSKAACDDGQIDAACLQMMHLGTSVIRQDKDWNKCTTLFLKLSRNNSLLMWTKPIGRITQFNSSQSNLIYTDEISQFSPFFPLLQIRYSSQTNPLYLTPDSTIPQPIISSVSNTSNTTNNNCSSQASSPNQHGAQLTNENQGVPNLSTLPSNISGSGYLDLLSVKHVYYSNGKSLPNIANIMRKFGYKEPDSHPDHCVISIVYGTSPSENRVLNLVFPSLCAKYWWIGLTCLIRSVRQSVGGNLRWGHQGVVDQRLTWIKQEYLRLFYSRDHSQGISLAEITRLFGGRRWSISSKASPLLLDNSPGNLSSSGYSNSKYSSVTSGTPNSSKYSNFKQKRASKIKKTDQKQLLSFMKNKSSISRESMSSQSPLISPMSKSMYEPTIAPLSPTLTTSQPRKSTPIPIGQDSVNQNTSAFSSPTNQNTPSYLRHSTFFSSTINRETQQSSRNIHLSLQKNQKSFDFSINQKNLSPPQSASSFSNTSSGCYSVSDLFTKSPMNFLEFADVFRSFMIYSRQDIKYIFDYFAVPLSQVDVSSPKLQCSQKPKKFPTPNDRLYYLTRNYASYSQFSESEQRHISAAIAVASIMSNCASYEQSHRKVMERKELVKFLRQFQGDGDLKNEGWSIIEKHEVDLELKNRGLLSFEGFSCYLMDEDNYLTGVLSDDSMMQMNQPLSHYFIASSHNTYLAGHQITGESCVEMYAQVLLTGCRCVELDCWDGEEGIPVIYHGHTFTNKIPFQNVVETIDRCAFETSPYPVILSIENHCSLSQQQKMAQIFKQVFGEKLVTSYLFESDFDDDPYLPSPEQLKYRILIKNKKLVYKYPISVFQEKSKTFQFRSNVVSMVTEQPCGITGEDIGNDDDEDDEDDDDDDGVTTATTATTTTSTSKLNKSSPPKQQSTDSESIKTNQDLNSISISQKLEKCVEEEPIEEQDEPDEPRNNTNDEDKYKSKKQDFDKSLNSKKNASSTKQQQQQMKKTNSQTQMVTNQIPGSGSLLRAKPIKSNSQQVDPELSALIVYTQAIKLRSLNLKLNNATSTNVNVNQPAGILNANITVTQPNNQPASSYVNNPNTNTSTNQKSKKITMKLKNQSSVHLQTNLLSVSLSPSPNNQSTSSLSSLTLSQNQSPYYPGLSSSPGTNNYSPSLLSNPNFSWRLQHGWNPPAHKIASISESKAKSLVRRQSAAYIRHCENQLLRCYPSGGKRIDSSNYNPVQVCWQFGIQLAALNYQTEDSGLDLNSAMFRQTRCSGYVLKPSVMRGTAAHRVGDNLSMEDPLILTIQIISGQNLNVTNPLGSCTVELELIGIQHDNFKVKTRNVTRNTVNPIWNETFNFEIYFPELAFVRFTVLETSTGHTLGQSTFAVNTLKKGFRHVSIRKHLGSSTGSTGAGSISNSGSNSSNNGSQFIQISSLFLFIKYKFHPSYQYPNNVTNHSNSDTNTPPFVTLETLDDTDIIDGTLLATGTANATTTTINTTASTNNNIDVPIPTNDDNSLANNDNVFDNKIPFNKLGNNKEDQSNKEPSPPNDSHYFILIGEDTIGMSAERRDSSSSKSNNSNNFTVLRISEEHTAADIIQQAIIKLHGGCINYLSFQETLDQYILLLEMSSGDDCMTQLVVDYEQSIMDFLEEMKLDVTSVRFRLRRKNSDPSSRAWLSTILQESVRQRDLISARQVIQPKNIRDCRARFQRQNEVGDSLSSSKDTDTKMMNEPSHCYDNSATDPAPNQNGVFLVCVYNVSEDQPYTILKAETDSTVQQIIRLALSKARRKTEDHSEFVLVEEMVSHPNLNQSTSSTTSSGNNQLVTRKILNGEDCLYSIQKQNNGAGKLTLKSKQDAGPYVQGDDIDVGQEINFTKKMTTWTLSKQIKENSDDKTNSQTKDSVVLLSYKELSPDIQSPLPDNQRFRTYSCPGNCPRNSILQQSSNHANHAKRFLWRFLPKQLSCPVNNSNNFISSITNPTNSTVSSTTSNSSISLLRLPEKLQKNSYFRKK